MLTHDSIWNAIDALAERYGLSASGLARKAGLDATSFNKSKRTSPDGRERWPSTESIAKILRATGASLDEFMRLVEPEGEIRRSTVPLISMSQGSSGQAFTKDGLPASSQGWDEIEFPDVGKEKVFALEVSGDALLPLYRDGDVLIVSPTAGARRGDRIVLRTTEGEITAGELRRRTAKTLELRSFGPESTGRTISVDQIEWLARVMWARQ